MTITDTPEKAFDKVSTEIVDSLPITIMRNSYIITMQDLLTKYSLAILLPQAAFNEITDTFIEHFICRFSAAKAF